MMLNGLIRYYICQIWLIEGEMRLLFPFLAFVSLLPAHQLRSDRSTRLWLLSMCASKTTPRSPSEILSRFCRMVLTVMELQQKWRLDSGWKNVNMFSRIRRSARGTLRRI